MAAYDLVLNRYGDHPTPALREQVASALFNKGATFSELGRSEEAVAAYDLVLDRYGDDPTLHHIASHRL